MGNGFTLPLFISSSCSNFLHSTWRDLKLYSIFFTRLLPVFIYLNKLINFRNGFKTKMVKSMAFVHTSNKHFENVNKKGLFRISLVAQWLRICLKIQGKWVRSLVREDPTCWGATKPIHHNYWVCMPQLLKLALSVAHVPQLLSPHAATAQACAPRARVPQQEKPLQWEAHVHNLLIHSNLNNVWPNKLKINIHSKK